MHLWQLVGLLNDWLQPQQYRDYCPNGLQVEGREEVRRVLTAVTANRRVIAEAIAQHADAILVHHGFFWKGESPEVVGVKKRRLQPLLAADISLIAYHLPLDGHPELGNNAQWARAMGWMVLGRFGEQSLGCVGELPQPQTVAELVAALGDRLGFAPTVVGNPHARVRRLAWCSGAAASYFEDALRQGAEAFVTGELSEPYVHLARDVGVPLIAAGHHATERFGVQALADRLRAEGLEAWFFDDPSPV